MKYYNIALILFCFCIAFITFGCEQTDLQKSTPSMINSNVVIDTRGDCDECPEINECCCAVYLDEGDDNASLIFCGTSNGPDNCNSTPACISTSFSGLGETIELDAFDPRMVFCMYENGGFTIYNYSMNDVANIIITCQNGMTNPDIVQLQIQPNSRVHYKTNGSCELLPCQ